MDERLGGLQLLRDLVGQARRTGLMHALATVSHGSGQPMRLHHSSPLLAGACRGLVDSFQPVRHVRNERTSFPWVARPGDCPPRPITTLYQRMCACTVMVPCFRCSMGMISTCSSLSWSLAKVHRRACTHCCQLRITLKTRKGAGMLRALTFLCHV